MAQRTRASESGRLIQSGRIGRFAFARVAIGQGQTSGIPILRPSDGNASAIQRPRRTRCAMMCAAATHGGLRCNQTTPRREVRVHPPKTRRPARKAPTPASGRRPGRHRPRRRRPARSRPARGSPCRPPPGTHLPVRNGIPRAARTRGRALRRPHPRRGSQPHLHLRCRRGPVSRRGSRSRVRLASAATHRPATSPAAAPARYLRPSSSSLHV
jgi:hypothetical protein